MKDENKVQYSVQKQKKILLCLHTDVPDRANLGIMTQDDDDDESPLVLVPFIMMLLVKGYLVWRVSIQPKGRFGVFC